MPDYKTRISKLEPVNNNVGQRLNLQDVWKVMEMRDCPIRSAYVLSEVS